VVEPQCIFVSKPEECGECLNSKKLQCLINHPHLVVSEHGQIELLFILYDNCHSPNRTKMVSGHHSEIHGGCDC